MSTIASETDVVLTGLPRSGTTLICYLLNKVPDAIALHEPMAVGEFPRLRTREAICDRIAQFLSEQRTSLRARGEALSRQIGGRVPDNPVASEANAAGLRPTVATLGVVHFNKPLSDRFLLCIKHPNAFSALLPDLAQRFRCYAVVRNPLSVLASWNSMDAKFAQGRAPAAERLDRNLSQALDKQRTPIDRELCLLSWYYEQYDRHLPPSQIIRYETIVETRGRALAAIIPAAAGLDESLQSRNANALYDRAVMQTLGKSLLESEGSQWKFYDRRDVEALLV